MVNVCRKMPVISTFGVALVGVAGFEPATPSSRTLGSSRNARIYKHFFVRSTTKHHLSFRFIGGRPVAAPVCSFKPAEVGRPRLYVGSSPWLCKNSRRYNRTRNFFGLYGHAESKKNAKICLPLGITTKSDFVFTDQARERTRSVLKNAHDFCLGRAERARERHYVAFLADRSTDSWLLAGTLLTCSKRLAVNVKLQQHRRMIRGSAGNPRSDTANPSPPRSSIQSSKDFGEKRAL